MHFVLVLSCRVDECMVEVTHHEVVHVGLPTIVQVSPEPGLRSGRANRHNSVFKLTVLGSECCLVLSAFFDPNEKVGALHIQFGKHTSFS